MIIPKNVNKILQKLNEAGFEAYIVGGCVRDCLLQRTPQDWDITTSATPQEVKKIFHKTYDTGLKHGTVTVILEKEHYEITTYRIEKEYYDCRHPSEVIFTKSLKEDLQRRDFTINAMAYHPKEGIQDYFYGQEHLKQKKIQGVGNPEERFQEDALRMLRALRFSAQLGFDIEPKTYQALQKQKKLIQKISAERIHEELEKMLQAQFLEKICFLWESGLLKEISPLLYQKMLSHGTEILQELKNVSFDRIVRWVIFLQYLTAKEGEQLLKDLRFDNHSIKAIVMLLEHLKDEIPLQEYEIRKKACEMTPEQLNRLFFIQGQKKDTTKWIFYLEKILERKDCLTLKTLAVKGKDLQQIGINGKEMGEVLSFLLDMVHKEPEKNKKQILLAAAKQK